jgi:hypothetical protein
MPDQSNTEIYAARVDAHLFGLPDNTARRAFLTSERAKWERRYALFTAKVLTNQPITDDDGTAADYVLTIAALSKRLAPLQEVAHV